MNEAGEATAMEHPGRSIRANFVEPSLAQYRVPFFRALARRVELKLFYAESGRANAEPDGFSARFAPRKTIRLLGHPIYWQSAQLEAVDARQADVVSFDWDVHYASLVPALLRAKRKKVATILWGHGTSANDGTWKVWPRNAIARLADVLVTYSPSARDKLIARGWPADRVFCAPNAIDQSPVERAYAAVREGETDEARVTTVTRERLGLDPFAPTLLFVSRLDKVRRLDVLIDAIPLLTAKHPPLQVVLVGDGPMRGPMHALVDRLEIADRVRFVGGEYDETRLAAWYAAADVVVHPAWLGLSVYHAMGHGRPIVTGDDPRFHPPEAESVMHEETGLRFRHGDPTACAAAIDRLLTDADLRKRLGDTARSRARTKHSIEAMVDGFEAAIRAAHARRHPRLKDTGQNPRE